ncbi:acylglycerol kinase, mitochondrial [Teleopsis dalmanni]|uniref:acylglycerol kinase, mitochondrial n=1 Tax=Teleopsis dalmanni TaxID=139649 RepID=UPI0018CEF9B5|nr:acylglycerol kinase, mitochondrial [Teleopsis dalmanni]XP_037927801.1 acylglycerol kinase, mitochondrial [Teleopsis dalmanni]
MKYLTVARNHWKKLSFGAVGLSYGGLVLKEKYDIRCHMRTMSQLISGYTGGTVDPKHVLVVVNPAANNKKAFKMFQKYCEPLLHLAGYSVNVFQTNYVGHAKSYVEELKTLPDAIVVAGGDGTSSEVVTGLLRREQNPCPILILPLGKTNKTIFNVTPSLVTNNEVEYVKRMSEAIIPLVNDSFQYKSVIKFNIINTENDSANSNLKPIYGLHNFSWGVLRDIESIKDKYWYFGRFRHYAAAFLNAFSNDLNWKLSTSFIYSPPCPGCRNCLIPEKQNDEINILRNFVFKNLSRKRNPAEFIENEDCIKCIEGEVDTNQMSVVCRHEEKDLHELETRFFSNFSPGFDFIKNISNITRNALEPSMLFKSREIKLFPKPQDPKSNFCYSIDGEEYEAHAIKMQIIPNAIKLIC